MLTIYPACFFKEESGYSVVFPDLNWLSTCGSTLEKATSMAIDCLAGYIYTCKMENEKIPDPSSVGDVDLQAIAAELELDDVAECFVNLVSVDVEQYAREHFNKSVKKTLSIPDWLNKAALERGINFSQTLQEALIAKIQA